VQVIYRLFRCPGSCGTQMVAIATADVHCGQDGCRAARMKPGRIVKEPRNLRKSPAEGHGKTVSDSKPPTTRRGRGSEKAATDDHGGTTSIYAPLPDSVNLDPLSVSLSRLAGQKTPIGEQAWRALIGTGALTCVGWGEWEWQDKRKPVGFIGSDLPAPLTTHQVSVLVLAWLRAQPEPTPTAAVNRITADLFISDSQAKDALALLADTDQVRVIREATVKRPMTVQVGQW